LPKLSGSKLFIAAMLVSLTATPALAESKYIERSAQGGGEALSRAIQGGKYHADTVCGRNNWANFDFEKKLEKSCSKNGRCTRVGIQVSFNCKP
jgi:hypothetical protein